MRPHECSKRLRGAPASIQAVDDGPRLESRLFGPLRDALRLAVPSDRAIRSSVSLLLNLSGPLAIAWFVATTVVNAVDRHALRSCSHIGSEVSEGQPSFTYTDATAAVARICGLVGIQASLKHRCPGAIFRRPNLSSCGSVDDEGISPRAATTTSVSGAKMAHGDGGGLAAVAAADPHDCSADALLRRSDSRQQPERFAGEVDQPCCVRVSAANLCDVFTHDAAATACVSTSEARRDDRVVRSAVTAAVPCSCGTFRSRADTAVRRDHRQAAESLSDEIEDLRHTISLAKTASMCFRGVAA